MKWFYKVSPRLYIKAIKDATVEKKFLLFFAPIILLFIITIPALQGFDEATHFLRAYQVSEVDLLPERFEGRHAGDKTPVDIVDLHDAAVSDLIQSAQSNLAKKASPGYYLRYIKDTSPDKNRVDKYFEGSAVYSPVSYLPQSLGIYIARTLRMPLLLYIFMGRLLNAALFIAVIYWAIKITPKGKWVIFAIAALPTSITTAATLSPDNIINAGTLLLVAYFIKAVFSKGRLLNKELLIILITCSFIALTKQAYFLFGFLFLFLPPVKSFGSWRRYLGWNSLFIITSLVLTLGWYSLIRDISGNIAIAHKPNAHINSAEQISGIISNPVHYSGVVAKEVFLKSNPRYIQLAGSLTWKGILMPLALISVVYFGMLLSFVHARTEPLKLSRILTKRNRLSIILGPLLICIGIILLIYTSLYITFNEVGSSVIDGVQGRYFIPVIGLFLPVALLIKRNKRLADDINPKRLESIIMTIIVIQTIAAFAIVFSTNYIPGIQFV